MMICSYYSDQLRGVLGWLNDLNGALGCLNANLWFGRQTAQGLVYRRGDIMVHGQLLDLNNFDHHLEGRWCLAFEDRLLGLAAAGLFVAQRDCLNTANDVRQGGI